jgi:membrane protein DedA with SNARE-associated domain
MIEFYACRRRGTAARPIPVWECGVPDFELIRDLLIAFGVFVGAGFGLPIPEEVAIVGAGLWTAAKVDSYPLYRWLMLPVCIVGVLIADIVLYSIGRFFGTRLLDRAWFARFVSKEKRERIEQNFDHYGVNILLFGRLLPGIRSPLFIIAGTMRLPVSRFVVADGLGAVLGNGLLFFLAFWFGDQFKELVGRVEGEVNRVRPLLILLGILAVGIYMLVHFLRRPVTTGDPEELPIIGHQVAVRIEHSSHILANPGSDEKKTVDSSAETREKKALGPRPP